MTLLSYVDLPKIVDIKNVKVTMTILNIVSLSYLMICAVV